MLFIHQISFILFSFDLIFSWSLPSWTHFLHLHFLSLSLVFLNNQFPFCFWKKIFELSLSHACIASLCLFCSSISSSVSSFCSSFFLVLYHMCFPCLSFVFLCLWPPVKTSIWNFCIVCHFTSLFGTFTALFVFACLFFLSVLFFFLRKSIHFSFSSYVFLNILLFVLSFFNFCFSFVSLFLPLLNVCTSEMNYSITRRRIRTEKLSDTDANDNGDNNATVHFTACVALHNWACARSLVPCTFSTHSHLAQVRALSAFSLHHHGHPCGCYLFDLTSSFYLFTFLLSDFLSPFFHLSDEQQPELNKKIMGKPAPLRGKRGWGHPRRLLLLHNSLSFGFPLSFFFFYYFLLSHTLFSKIQNSVFLICFSFSCSEGEIFLCVCSFFLFSWEEKISLWLLVLTHFEASFFISTLFLSKKPFSKNSLLECLLYLFISTFLHPLSTCSICCLSVFSRFSNFFPPFKKFVLVLWLYLCFLSLSLSWQIFVSL